MEKKTVYIETSIVSYLTTQQVQSLHLQRCHRKGWKR